MSDFRAQARFQAGWCAKLGSPFTAHVCTLLAERLPRGSALGTLLDGWPGDPFADQLALRVAGGLHARVRSGAAAALARLWPPAPPAGAEALWAAMAPELDSAELLAFVQRAPQTNEVMRSGVLAPGMLVARAASGLPLALFELGASAGLNLLPDRYRLELGGVLAGDPQSPLCIAPAWEGPPPPAVALEVASRAGCDLVPLDLRETAEQQRMLAYVWPDQPDRLQRMAAAIALAAADPPLLLALDAAEFVDRHVQLRDGRLTLLFHSIAFQYFPAATQARIVARLDALGRQATAAAPLGWLRFEQDDPRAADPPALRLRLWPDGTDRLLARAHPHGSRIQWLG